MTERASLTELPAMCLRGKRRILKRVLRAIVKYSQDLIFIP